MSSCFIITIIITVIITNIITIIITIIISSSSSSSSSSGSSIIIVIITIITIMPLLESQPNCSRSPALAFDLLPPTWRCRDPVPGRSCRPSCWQRPEPRNRS